MTFTTLNHTYTLVDAGDWGWLISGHPKYCPTPTLVRLMGEVKVGCSVIASYVGKSLSSNGMFKTTPVVEINT